MAVTHVHSSPSKVATPTSTISHPRSDNHHYDGSNYKDEEGRREANARLQKGDEHGNNGASVPSFTLRRTLCRVTQADTNDAGVAQPNVEGDGGA